MKKLIKDNSGHIIIQIVVFGVVAVYLLTSLVGWAVFSLKAARQTFNREQVLHIAEAGIDYYRWHLAHSPTDFQDGTGVPGPYVHDFYDKDGNAIGKFSLEITPSPVGSTLVIIKSTGSLNADPLISRSITVHLAKPSIAKYAAAANAAMRFGAGTEIFGPVHSNGGIRFDGLAHNIVSSAVSRYNDLDSDDCTFGTYSLGVHTCLTPKDPAYPSAPPSRTDVFEVGRQFPVPAVDFTGITADLAQMKTIAQTEGFYRSNSGGLGYHVVLRTDDLFDFYSVTSFVSPPSGCTNSQDQTGWSTWSIGNQTYIGTFPFPDNGIIFLEDDVFVDGQIDVGRVTIIAAFLPDGPLTRKNIIINNDLLYTNYDGSDVIGLIAQGNVNVGLESEDDLTIDAALIAQNGRIGRYYYRPPDHWSPRCNPYHARQTITLWGMIATNERYGFGYTDGTGYSVRNLNYDGSLLYAPPPSFPLTSDQYMTLIWEEQ